MKIKTPVKILFIAIAIIVVLSVSIIFIIKYQKNNNAVGENPNDTILTITPEQEYGVYTAGLYIIRDTFHEGEFLSDVLIPEGVSYQKIDKLVNVADTIFNVTKFKAGNIYSIIKESEDSNAKVLYFAYEINPIEYVLFDLRNNVKITFGEKEVTYIEKTFIGNIESSLWNSIVDHDEDPNLALMLNDIYAWNIDFYGLQIGDNYKTTYEESYVGDERVGIHRIISAYFYHSDVPYYAFWYEKDTIKSYFDEKGESCQRAFLKAPLQFSFISSRYSEARMHPILKTYTTHHGVDYAAPFGTPVKSVGTGTVIHAAYSGGAGNYIKIKHNATYTTGYMHLSAYGEGIQVGAHVDQGQVIGYVGSTGLSTGPHLDFRYYKNGVAINPLTVESPPAYPIDSTLLDDYKEYIKPLMEELSKLR